MNALLERIKKNSTIKETDILSDSEVFKKGLKFITTQVPMINVALSGRLKGGMPPGLLQVAGPSKHFKTGYALLLMKAHLDSDPDAVVILYDSEFGSPESYFRTFNIDTSRIIHTPITDIEYLKVDLATQINELEREDNVLIVIDSVGNLASRKEAEDALDGKTVADMTRAKQLKSTFRIVTPHLTLKQIPMVVVNHTYKEIGLFPKDIVGGGTGSYYSSDAIWIIGRQQDKKGTELLGYNFVITIEKSRFVKEKAKIPINIQYDGGINQWSGLLDLAMEAGYVVNDTEKKTKLCRVDTVTGEIEDRTWKKDETNCEEFWRPLLDSKEFDDFVYNKYSVDSGEMIANFEEAEDVDLS